MIAAIVARSRNNVIGSNGDIPWHLPDDMKYFRDQTRGHPVVMGRKTAESIVNHLGHGLPDRYNIVVTRDPDYKLEGFVTAHSIDNALDLAGDDAFVIGGAQIYQEALPYCDRLYITEVDAEIIGDTYFPKFDKNEWNVALEIPHPADEEHAYPFTYKVLERKKQA